MNEEIPVSDGFDADSVVDADVGALAARREALEAAGGNPEELAAVTLAWARAAEAAGSPDAVAALAMALTRATRPAVRAALCDALTRHALNDGDVERALRMLDTRDAATDHVAVDAWLDLAARAADLRRADVASDAGERALASLPEADPRRALLHRALASAAGQRGLLAAALEHTEAALAGVDGDDAADLYEFAAELLDGAGRDADAMAWREAAVDRLAGSDAPRARAWMALAAAHARQKDVAAVREATREAVSTLARTADIEAQVAAHERAAELLDAVGQHDLAQDHVAWATASARGDEAPPWTSLQAAAAAIVRPRSAEEATAALAYLEAFATRSRDEAMREATLRMLVDALPWSRPGAIARALGVLIGAGAPPWAHHVVRAQLTNVLKAALPFADALRHLGVTAAERVQPTLWQIAAREQPAGEAAMAALGPCALGYADILAVAAEARQAARADSALLEAMRASLDRLPQVAPVRRVLDALDREDVLVLDATHGASWRVRCTGVLHVGQLLVLFDTLGGPEAAVSASEELREVARGRSPWKPGLLASTEWSTWSWPALRDGLDVGGEAIAPDRHRAKPDTPLRDLPRLGGRPVLVLAASAPYSFELAEPPPLSAWIERGDPLAPAEHLVVVERIEAARSTLDFRRHDERALLASAEAAAADADLDRAIGIAEWLLTRLDVPGASMEPVEPLRLLIDAHAQLGEWEEAADAARLLVAWLDRGGETRTADLADALLDLGTAHERSGDRASATAAFERAQRIATRHPGTHYAVLVRCHRRMSEWFAETSRVQTAIGHLDQAASLLSTGSDPGTLADTLRSLAALQARQAGAPEAALNTLLYAAEARREAVGDRHPDVAADLRDIAALLDVVGRHAEASAARDEARALLADCWYTLDRIGLAAMQADLDAPARADDAEESVWLSDRAWRTSASLNGTTDRGTLALAARTIALLRETGRDEEAARLSAHVRQAAQGSSDPLALAEAICCEAEELAAAGAIESAREPLARASEILAAHPDDTLRGRLLLVAAHLHGLLGDGASAERATRQAIPLLAARPDLQRRATRALDAVDAAPPALTGDSWDDRDETPTEA